MSSATISSQELENLLYSTPRLVEESMLDSLNRSGKYELKILEMIPAPDLDGYILKFDDPIYF